LCNRHDQNFATRHAANHKPVGRTLAVVFVELGVAKENVHSIVEAKTLASGKMRGVAHVHLERILRVEKCEDHRNTCSGLDYRGTLYHMNLRTAMLADGARIGSDGKLYIFGGQWDSVFAPSVPTTQKVAFALVIEVEYSEALKPHQIEIALVNEDGADVGVRIAAQLQAGIPPLTKEGDPVVVPLAVEPPPIPLPSYQRYVWRILLDGEEKGFLPMTVRQPSIMQLQPEVPPGAVA
jgi:hypothetical protein